MTTGTDNKASQKAILKKAFIRSSLLTVAACLLIFAICRDFYLGLTISVFGSFFVFIPSFVAQCLYWKIPVQPNLPDLFEPASEFDKHWSTHPFNPSSITYVYSNRPNDDWPYHR